MSILPRSLFVNILVISPSMARFGGFEFFLLSFVWICVATRICVDNSFLGGLVYLYCIVICGQGFEWRDVR